MQALLTTVIVTQVSGDPKWPPATMEEIRGNWMEKSVSICREDQSTYTFAENVLLFWILLLVVYIIVS